MTNSARHTSYGTAGIATTSTSPTSTAARDARTLYCHTRSSIIALPGSDATPIASSANPKRELTPLVDEPRCTISALASKAVFKTAQKQLAPSRHGHSSTAVSDSLAGFLRSASAAFLSASIFSNFSATTARPL